MIKPMQQRMEEQKQYIAEQMGREVYEKVLRILMIHKQNDSDSSDIVLTDSSAPSYALEDRWEDVTKEVSVDEELARLEGRGLEVAEPRLMHG